MSRKGVVLLLACGTAYAQQPDCPAAKDLQPRQAIGAWQAQVEGAPLATLLLRPHPRYRESLSGEIDRAGRRSQVAADIDGGELTLEESDDGVHISATWLGEVVEGSCGREIRGTWEPAGAPPKPFVLRRGS